MKFASKPLKTSKGVYHIHLDVTHLSSDSEIDVLEKLAFKDTAFSGHAPDSRYWEPPKHFSFKTQEYSEFSEKFNSLQEYCESRKNDVVGYIEGEYVPLDVTLPEKDFDPNVPIPFTLTIENLPLGGFREDEVHITMNRDTSDPRLLKNLRMMGFFSAYMDKSQENVEIFTAQGSRKTIKTILQRTHNYLTVAGGFKNCSIKEEMILRWWKSDPQIAIPPVVISVSTQV
jgi:hypothetical protein